MALLSEIQARFSANATVHFVKFRVVEAGLHWWLR